MAVVNSRKTKAKATPKAEAAPGEPPRGSRAAIGGAKKKYAYTCMICLDPGKPCGQNPFCKDCKCDNEALKKDAKQRSKEAQYERARRDPELFRKLFLDYKSRCTSRGAGVKRDAYDWGRLEEMISKSHVQQRGANAVKIDGFDWRR